MIVATRYWRCKQCDFECASGPEMIAHLQSHEITREQIRFWAHDEWRVECSS